MIIRDKSRMPVPVDACSTKRGSSEILFDAWCLPSSKCSKIRKTWSVIVMSIPQWNPHWSLPTSIIASENCAPHISWRINPHFFSFSLHCSNCFHHKGAIWGRIMTTPRASRTWISFHINPNSFIERSRNVSNEVIDLLGCIFSSTREHISVCFKACSFDICQALNCMHINCTVGVISTSNSKCDVSIFHTGIVLHWEKLRNVDSEGTVTCSE